MAAMKKVSKELGAKKLTEFKKLVTKQAKAVYLKAMGFTAQEMAFNLKTSVASVQSMICKSKAKSPAKLEKTVKASKSVKEENVNLDGFTTKQDKAVYLKTLGWTSDSIATLLITSIASIHSMISKSKSKVKLQLIVEKKKKEPKAKKVKELTVEEKAAAEVKRRADLKKNDKIFNNSYFQADKLKGDDYVFDKSIKIDPGYHGSSQLANLAPEKAMVYNNMRRLMIKALDNHPEMKEMFSEDKKLNKSMLNNAFAILYESVASNREENIFVNVIYLFDFLSNISGVKYPNLFEMLEYKYKELLIQELDEEFNILGDYVNLRKMF